MMNNRYNGGSTARGLDAAVPADIIRIRDYRIPPPRQLRKRSGAGGVFWNTVFVGLCLAAVFVVLFLH